MGVLEQNKRNRISLGQDNNALTWLLILNGVVFVLINFIKIIYLLSDTSVALFYSQVLHNFTLPADLNQLIYKPWTILSYMFTHESFWLLIRNILWMWGFGYILQDLAGNNKLFPIYLYGGFTGAVLFLLATNLLPSFHSNISAVPPAIGAGAAVMALGAAVTTLSPNFRIFPMLRGGIPLWVVFLIFLILDFSSISNGPMSSPYILAHIGSGAIGYIFVRQLRRGSDWSKWMNDTLDWINDLFNPEKKHAKPASKKHFYKITKKPFEKTPHITQQRLDEILDKINQKGFHLLTEEEKDFLKKASKEDI